MKQTAVILGSHPRTRGLFDFNRTDADVWVFNEAATTIFAPHADKIAGVFQLHSPTIWRNPNNRNDPRHYDWLKTTSTPVFMQERYDEVPASVCFPKDEILALSPFREVSCTPAWAVAYAIWLGYKRIEVYGVELESGTEYNYQQGNFKYWLGVAVGRGIEVVTHTTMFDNPLYGYEGEVEIPYSAIEQRIGELMLLTEQHKQNAQITAQHLDIVLQAFLHGDNGKQVLQAVTDHNKTNAELTTYSGALQANEYYKLKADEMIKKSERFVFSRQEFEHNMKVAQMNAAQFQAEYNAYGGQMQIHHARVVNCAKGSPKRVKALNEYRATLGQYFTASAKVAAWTGAATENARYMARLDAGIKAAGGVKSEEAMLAA